MVCNHSEDRISPKAFFPGGTKELTQCKIRIFHCIFSFSLVGIFGNSSLGIGEGLVIGDRENGRKEWIARSREVFAFLHRACEQILVANSPNRGEGWVFEMFLLDKTVVTIAHSKRAHPVEEPAAAIKKDGGISVALQDAG